MTITKERLAEIKARCDAAFMAPWTYEDFTVLCDHPYDIDDEDKCPTCHGEGEADVVRIESPNEYPDGQIIADVPGLERFAAANGSFIAHARTDVPALLAEVERLRELMARWVDPSLVLELLKAEKNALKKEVERLRWLLLTAISTTEKCPWCRRPHNEEHSAFCQAFGASFTPEGEVK